MYMLLCGPMFSFLLEIHLGVGLLSVTVFLFFFFLSKKYIGTYFFFFLIIYLFFLAMPGLNCGMWDLVPWPGIEPGPPSLGAQNLSHWTTRETPVDISLYLSSFSPIPILAPVWALQDLLFELETACPFKLTLQAKPADSASSVNFQQLSEWQLFLLITLSTNSFHLNANSGLPLTDLVYCRISFLFLTSSSFPETPCLLSAHSPTLFWSMGFPGGSDGKRIHLQCRRPGFYPLVGKIPWRRKWQPIQYSCFENLTDRGAWQATVHAVAKSQTLLSD